MRIQQPDSIQKGPKSAQKPAEQQRGPVIPDLSGYYDKGLMEGFNIDPEDLVNKTTKFNSSTALSSKAPHSTETAEDGWMRQEPPSLGVPYGVTALYVRPFDNAILSRVHAAQQAGQKEGQQQQALTMLLDALNPTIKDFDIRDLTVPDYYSHMYWLRLNSYPRTPMTVPWTSRYGNENTIRITRSSFEFQELAMSRDEYLSWRKRGLSFPTVREMEVLTAGDIEEDMRWTITYAQYIYVEGRPNADTMKKKIAIFDAMGPEAVPMINEFASKMGHGVVEQIKARDELFNLDNAIAYIENEIAQFAKIVNAVLDDDQSDNTQIGSLLTFKNHIEARATELTMLREIKANNGLTSEGKRFVPEEEVVVLASATAAILFP